MPHYERYDSTQIKKSKEKKERKSKSKSWKRKHRTSWYTVCY